MTTLNVAKYHGTANDFLILLDLDNSRPLTAALARAVCDRHRGVGADGVIRATRLDHMGSVGADGVAAKLGVAGAERAVAGGSVAVVDRAVLRFELRNADGSGAEMSGNGMRCLAHAALDAGLVPFGAPFVVITPAGPRTVTVWPSDSPGAAWAVVDMGVVGVCADAGAGRLRVDAGNPHLVILVDDLASVAVADIGAGFDREEPGGLNVEFATVGPGPDQATMRVWERGVGETQACGTGSCAAAVALHHWGLAGRQLSVVQPGGTVEVTLADGGSVTLAGPSQRVGLVSLQLEDLPA